MPARLLACLPAAHLTSPTPTDRIPQGPLVGNRQSSAAITSQYANADPVYRIKTAALPAKYAYFRTCRGDGHCGWRGQLPPSSLVSACPRCPAPPLTRTAIAFTYFEALIRLGDIHKFDHEEVRLNSLGNLLEQINYSRDIWIDFADEAFGLLRKLAASLSNMDGAADDILLQSFNDMNVSMAIITYFKVIPSPCPRPAPPNLFSFSPVPGSSRTQTTMATLSPWAMSRPTVPTTSSPRSAKPTTSASRPWPMPSSSLLASASRSGTWTARRVRRSTGAITPSPQTPTTCPSRMLPC